MSSLKKSIVIVDDHPMMRKGLTMTLKANPAYHVTAQISKAEEALQRYEELDPDLMLIDISLPGMSGLELVKQLISRDANVKILVISRHDESLYAERVIRAGAKGYVMKLEAGDVLLKAARKVMNGGIYLSDEISDRLIMGLSHGQKEIAESPVDVLSDRELEVLELTGKGNNTREVAEKLHLSIKTIESYRARIKTKLHLDNATELMVHAIKWAEDENVEFQ